MAASLRTTESNLGTKGAALCGFCHVDAWILASLGGSEVAFVSLELNEGTEQSLPLSPSLSLSLSLSVSRSVLQVKQKEGQTRRPISICTELTPPPRQEPGPVSAGPRSLLFATGSLAARCSLSPHVAQRKRTRERQSRQLLCCSIRIRPAKTPCPTRARRSAATGACEQSVVSFIPLAIRIISHLLETYLRMKTGTMGAAC